MMPSIFEMVEGLQPVDPASLEEYERAMDEAIPQMLEDDRERRRLAAQARTRIIIFKMKG